MCIRSRAIAVMCSLRPRGAAPPTAIPTSTRDPAPMGEQIAFQAVKFKSRSKRIVGEPHRKSGTPCRRTGQLEVMQTIDGTPQSVRRQVSLLAGRKYHGECAG
jgi:hypothetical protein